MDFKVHLEKAWHLTLKFIVPLIIMTLVMFVVSVATIGILAPVTAAGYMQSILLMLRSGREPKVQDIFSQMKLFFPLLFFGFVVFFAVVIGFLLLLLPGILIALAVSFLCLYMLPLMTDKQLGLFDAIKESYSMTTRESIADNIVVFIIFAGLLSIGSSIFIGILFTQPFAMVFLLSVYEEKISNTKKSSSQNIEAST